MRCQFLHMQPHENFEKYKKIMELAEENSELFFEYSK